MKKTSEAVHNERWDATTVSFCSGDKKLMYTGKELYSFFIDDMTEKFTSNMRNNDI